MTASPDKLERNLRLYPWCIAAFQAYCWLPVFFLFFSEKLPIERVLLLEAVYFGAICLLEVPSGYFADRVGRRTTLVISAVAILAAHSMFFFGSFLDDVFLPYCAGQAALALGLAFRNGTETAFHFDTLHSLGRSDEYAAREARSSRAGFLANAGAALAGGAAASFELRYAYLLSLLAALVLLGIVLAFVEPVSHERQLALKGGFMKQLAACGTQLNNPTLRWLFGFAVFMVIVNHVPYEFYQPYLSALTFDNELLSRSTPLAVGAHAFVSMLLASWIAARSVQVRDRIGVTATLLASAVLQVGTVILMGLALHPLIAVLLLARSCPRALMTAPMNAEITPRVPQNLRATYLSVQSLVGRSAFSGVLAGLPLATALLWGATEGQHDWARLSAMLQLCAGLGIFGLLLLGLTSFALKRGTEDSAHGAALPAER